MLLFLTLSTYLFGSIEDVQIITTNLEKAAARVELKISQDKPKPWPSNKTLVTEQVMKSR